MVSKGWQVESGATWTKSRGERTVSLPETLIRWGVGPSVEARLELPDYTASPDAKAWGEVGLGLKGRLNAPRGLDGSAWIASIGIPTEVSQARPSLAAAWVWDRSLARFDLAGMTATRFSDGRVAWTQTLTLSTELSQRMSAFVEGVAEGQRSLDDAILHVGLAYRPSSRRQWDVHAGVGRPSASGIFIGIGYSERR